MADSRTSEFEFGMIQPGDNCEVFCPELKIVIYAPVFDTLK